MKNVSNFDQTCFTDTNQPEPANLLTRRGHTTSIHPPWLRPRLSPGTLASQPPPGMKRSDLWRGNWREQPQLLRRILIRKGPGIPGGEAGVCVRARTIGSDTWAFKSAAELLRQGGRLSSERVRLVPSSENNWPVPSPIHQSDSTWPRGNEWTNKGGRIQCADEVEPAG